MPRQETITIHSFNELSEEIQKKLVDRYSIPRFWDDPILEMFEDEGEKMGIEDFYVHEKTVSAFIEGSTGEEEENIFEEAFNSWKDDLCKEWYDTLYQAYVGYHEVELIKSIYIEMGECFLENGKQF